MQGMQSHCSVTWAGTEILTVNISPGEDHDGSLFHKGVEERKWAHLLSAGLPSLYHRPSRGYHYTVLNEVGPIATQADSELGVP